VISPDTNYNTIIQPIFAGSAIRQVHQRQHLWPVCPLSNVIRMSFNGRVKWLSWGGIWHGHNGTVLSQLSVVYFQINLSDRSTFYPINIYIGYWVPALTSLFHSNNHDDCNCSQLTQTDPGKFGTCEPDRIAEHCNSQCACWTSGHSTSTLHQVEMVSRSATVSQDISQDDADYAERNKARFKKRLEDRWICKLPGHTYCFANLSNLHVPLSQQDIETWVQCMVCHTISAVI
jgi:hypothetical protein